MKQHTAVWRTYQYLYCLPSKYRHILMKTLKEEYVASALNQYLNEPINMDFSKQGEKNSPLYCDRQTKPSSALRK